MARRSKSTTFRSWNYGTPSFNPLPSGVVIHPWMPETLQYQRHVVAWIAGKNYYDTEDLFRNLVEVPC